MSGPARQGGTGRVGIVENWELRQNKQQDANSGAFKGIIFVIVALGFIVVGGWYAARPMIGPVVEDVFQDNPGIVDYPLVSDLLAAEFGDRIDTPVAGAGNEEVEFVIGTDIPAGTALDAVQAGLAEQGLLDDEVAFRYAMARDSVDELIRPGTFTLTPPITPASIAQRLALAPDPPTPLVVLDMNIQRRLEQYAAYLQQEIEKDDRIELDPNEFKRLTRNPPNRLRQDYAFLSTLPGDNTLEGYLYPGTYEIEVDITAEELIRQMLDKWNARMSGYIKQAKNKNIDFYDALTIASLVEREAKADKDRRKIAGVYWNRLDDKLARKAGTNGLLQADPTVVYARDSMELEDLAVNEWDEYFFWDLLGISDYSTFEVDPKYASYQTYQNPGLPDSPIVTPTVKSMEAALNPATKGKNMFFYACPDSDTHKFAKNANKHQKNINSC